MISKIPTLNINRHKFGSSEIILIQGSIKLETWKGYQSRLGDYNSIDKIDKSDGSVKLEVGGDMVIEFPEIKIDHVNSYNFLLENQQLLRDNILSELINYYNFLKEEYNYSEEDLELMPDITHVNDFSNLIGLSTIHLLNVFKDDFAYVGYEFGCNWDEEHGLGILTYKDRIIEIGCADTSYLTWKAENDLNN